MSSISGGSQPVALGSGKLLKKLNVPVYVSLIKGGYLVSPKYNLIERPGKVEVSYKKLFSVDDLSRLNADEIQDILNKEIQTNDYLYNETAKTGLLFGGLYSAIVISGIHHSFHAIELGLIATTGFNWSCHWWSSSWSLCSSY